MTYKAKLSSITIFLLLIFSISVSANEKTIENNMITIGDVDGEAVKKFTIVNIRFDKKPEWKKIKLSTHDNFLQLDLPNTLVPNPGVFHNIESPYLKKIVLFQTKETHAIARIITAGETNKINDATDVDILNNRIVITTDHTALKGLSTNSQALSSHDSKQDKKNITASEPPNIENVESPAAKIISDKNKAEITAPNAEENINTHLKKMALVSIGMLLILLVFLSLKRFIKNKRFGTHPENGLQMTALNHLVLAPKQKISLVQVGKEKLLLSVTPEGINLITKYATPENQNISLRHNPVRLPHEAKKNSRAIKTVNANKNQNKSTQTVSPPISQKQENVPKTTSKHIQYAVGDKGIEKKTPKKQAFQASSTEKAIDDVTKLIREKLKSLPKL